MKIQHILAFLGFLLLCFTVPAAQEVIHPESESVFVTYESSSDYLDSSDTLVIVRNILNSSGIRLENLFLSECVPAGLVLLDYNISINGNSISSLFSGPVRDDVYISTYSYRWTIDLPDSTDRFNHKLYPGDILELSYRIAAITPGSYTFPFHTVCYSSENGGYFTTASSFSVIFVSPRCEYVPGDANNNGIINGLDLIFMVNFLKGGVVPEISCYCPPSGVLFAACDVNGSCGFSGIDVTYLLNYFKNEGSQPTFCQTCPPE